MPHLISVDLGGTNLRAAYFSQPEPPAEKICKKATLAAEGPEAVIQRLMEAIETILPAGKGGPLRIGVASPGPLNPYTGVLLSPPNLPGWKEIPLRRILTGRFRCPVSIANDANLAALGEWRFGAGRGTRNMIYLTVSTGIGGGVIAEGKLVQGARGLASELGHMSVVPGGPLCACGQAGHLEAVASGRAIARTALERLHQGESSSLGEAFSASKEISARDVGLAAQAGDALAISVISQAAELIGRHLAQLAHAFNPEIFIIGGGVSQAGDLFFGPIRSSLREHAMHPAFVKDVRVVPPQLGDHAGLIGAMLLASELRSPT